MPDFHALAQQCAPFVHPVTMAAVARVESAFNPYAIGVVGGRLERQPVNMTEALATARALEAAGYNFSLGIGQVNRHNLSRYRLDYQAAFEPCANLRAASLILKDCYDRARGKGLADDSALQAAFSCYYSGNFSTGFRPDFKGQPSYVQKVLDSAGGVSTTKAVPIRVIPTAKVTVTTTRRAPHAFRMTAGTRDGPPVGPEGERLEGTSVMVYR